MIARYGIATGLRTGFVVTLGLAAISALIVMTIRIPPLQTAQTNIAGVWRSFHSALKRLLVSDIIIRTCEGMADVFVILYATNIIGVSAARYGVLVAIQMTTSLLVYLPAARIADKIGRKPFVIVTFLCFALFPIAVVYSYNFASLVLAFIVGGLREIGEPSRKAMIVDFAEPALRARSVGLYYLIRCLTVTPAAAIGGLLWKISPSTPFITAGMIGFVGVIVFAMTVEERYAG